MMYSLPTSVVVCGTEYKIETDYRSILDIISVLNDPDLSNEEKGIGILGIFYLGFVHMPEQHFEEALRQCYAFIDGGGTADPKNNGPKLMDWEQDFRYLIAPINRIAGKEIRAAEYVHWWTFLSWYTEIGECYFAHIVRIRDLKAKGKLKDKTDREFYRKNKDVVDIKRRYSETEDEIINRWI